VFPFISIDIKQIYYKTDNGTLIPESACDIVVGTNDEFSFVIDASDPLGQDLLSWSLVAYWGDDKSGYPPPSLLSLSLSSLSPLSPLLSLLSSLRSSIPLTHGCRYVASDSYASHSSAVKWLGPSYSTVPSPM
jgi:hypothetical protein